MAGVAPTSHVPLRVINAITACSWNLADATISVTQIFMGDFKTYKNISNEDINDTLKTFFILKIT